MLEVDTIVAFNAITGVADFAFMLEQSISHGITTYLSQNRGKTGKAMPQEKIAPDKFSQNETTRIVRGFRAGLKPEFFRGCGRMKVTLFGTFVQASIRVVMTYLLAPQMGIYGITVACATGWSCMLLYEVPYYFYSKNVHMEVYFHNFVIEYHPADKEGISFLICVSFLFQVPYM